eukprot:2527664-Amphidinium_carterae.1
MSRHGTRKAGGDHRNLSIRAWVTGAISIGFARVTGRALARLARPLYRLSLTPTRDYGQHLPFRKLCRDFQPFPLHTEVLPGLSLSLQVKPALALHLPLLPTKAGTCHDDLLALGKASMLQTRIHPQNSFLGWGWFKRSWFKGPGCTGQNLMRQDTVAHFGCAYVVCHKNCAEQLTLWTCASTCANFCSHEQPFQHRLCRQTACQSLRVAQLLLPDLAHCGRGSGTTCTHSLFTGDAERSLQCQHAARMRRHSPL